MSTELANNSVYETRNLKALLNSDKVKNQIAKALPKHMTPDRFLRVATTAFLRNPKLLECDQNSFMQCMMDLSALGLEPDGRVAHLIPFNNRKKNIVECQLIVDYKGLIELAKRNGDVRSWKAETVCESDSFTWRNGEIDHEIDWRSGDRGKLQCVYSIVKLNNGEIDTEVMTLAEVNKIRERSKSKDSGPWVTDFIEQAKKTVMRRHSKRLTLSPEFHDALEKDATGFEPIQVRNVTPRQEKLTAESNPFEQSEQEPVTIAQLMERDGITESALLIDLSSAGICKADIKGIEALDADQVAHVIAEWDAITKGGQA